MPSRPCPACAATALRYLPKVSVEASVHYYRCDACGHIFTVAKGAPDAAPAQLSHDAERPRGPGTRDQ